MNAIAYIAIFGWIPVAIYIFNRLPIRQAVVFSFIAAWLFLPLVDLKLVTGLPAYSKFSATCVGILLACIIFDAKRLSSFQFSWLDLPMLVLCLCPFASSISNGLGPYDGLSAIAGQVITWGIPYYLGRVYLKDLDGLRKLAIGIFIGGLVYVPFCLYEIRTSPQLHVQLYGFGSPHFLQEIRYGGFRPEVFMESGLMVGQWMITATLIGIWLWQAGAIKQIRGFRIEWLVALLLITSILCKATGAILLLVVGVTILGFAKWFRNSLIVLILIMGILFQIYTGATGSFNSEQFVNAVSTNINPDRAQSLQVRFDNEKLLSSKALQKPIFGWAGWGRSRISNRLTGKDDSITDSYWIIIFGVSGTVGLVSWLATSLLPVIRFVQLYPASLWLNPKVAPAAALAVTLILFVMDCLSNAMLNPVYTLACGGLTGLVIRAPKTSKSRTPRLSAVGR